MLSANNAKGSLTVGCDELGCVRAAVADGSARAVTSMLSSALVPSSACVVGTLYGAGLDAAREADLVLALAAVNVSAVGVAPATVELGVLTG